MRRILLSSENVGHTKTQNLAMKTPTQSKHFSVPSFQNDPPPPPPDPVPLSPNLEGHDKRNGNGRADARPVKGARSTNDEASGEPRQWID